MPKTAQVNPESQKRAVLQALSQVREKILTSATALPEEKQNQVFLGIWGVHQLLAHQAGWDYANMEAVEAVLGERLPAFYAHYDKDWKTFNAMLVAQYRQDNLGEQVELARHSHQALAAYLETNSAADFVKDTGVRFHGWRVTIERLLKAEISDEERHFEQIAAFAALPLIPFTG